MARNSVGIIGYGRFGKLLADILSDEFNIIPYDNNVFTGNTLDRAASADSIFLCVPILELEATIKEVAAFVRSDSTVLDVCSVKLYPELLLKKYFRGEHVLPTHPMFGPDAAQNGLENLPIVLCPTSETKQEITEYWSQVFSQRKLSVQVMSSDEHDRIAAYSLCLTQFIGRSLSLLQLIESTIDTQNFRNLLTIRDMAVNDSCQLFEGLQTLNPYAEKMRSDLIASFTKIHDNLKVG